MLRRLIFPVFASRTICFVAVVFVTALFGAIASADIIELANGKKFVGKFLSSDDESITIQLVHDGQTFTRRLPRSQVAAVTINGRRYENPGGEPSTRPSTPPQTGTRTPPAGGSGTGTQGASRSAAEVKAMIDRIGRTPPDWYSSVQLQYPRTLDLSWPMPPPKPWNAQRNVGQYIWEVVNQNPNRWKEGIRLMHHMLAVNKNNSRTMQRIMNSMGRMYKNFLGDYARSAFWYQLSGAERGGPGALHLAECYYKLGNKQMALTLIARQPVQFLTIKLLADMGETDRALRIADGSLNGPAGDVAAIYAADACRVAGRLDKAMQYYQFILNIPVRGGPVNNRLKKNKLRARESIAALQRLKGLNINLIADGTYQASAMGYIGPITVSITVRNHRIQACRVVSHTEDQSYSSTFVIPQRIVQKQSLLGIDAVSSATMTSEAILNAAAKALTSGSR